MLKQPLLATTVAILLGTSSAALAASDSSLYTLKKADNPWQAKDHWSASTDLLALGYGTAQGFVFAARPKLEYFIVDRLAVGGFIGLATSGAGGYVEIGPSATYHFWEEKQFSSYGTANFAVGGTGSAPAYAKLGLAAGLNFNFDRFAFGPSFNVSVSSGTEGLQVGFHIVNLFFYF